MSETQMAEQIQTLRLATTLQNLMYHIARAREWDCDVAVGELDADAKARGSVPGVTFTIKINGGA